MYCFICYLSRVSSNYFKEQRKVGFSSKTLLHSLISIAIGSTVLKTFHAGGEEKEAGRAEQPGQPADDRPLLNHQAHHALQSRLGFKVGYNQLTIKLMQVGICIVHRYIEMIDIYIKFLLGLKKC